MNGNYLVVIVSIGIILPLSMLKNLGNNSLCTIELNIVQLFRHVLCDSDTHNTAADF